MGPHKQFPMHYHQCITDKQEKTDQQFRPIIALVDEEKTDKEDRQAIEEASQDNEAIIACPLKYLVNNGLKQPVIVVPGLGRRNVGKEGVLGDGAVLPEIPAAGEVIPQIGIVSHNGPRDEVAGQNQKKQGD